MKVFTRTETRARLKDGVDTMADIVKVTLGPNGKNVVLANPYDVSIVNDGATIAKEVLLDDPVENAGAMLARQCADKTNREAGDGTTTTLILLQAYLGGMKEDSPRETREEIQRNLSDVLSRIDALKRPLADGEKRTIAKNASLDDDIADAVSEVVELDGVTDIEELDKFGIETEKVTGLRIDDGMMYQHFATTTDNLKAEITDCPVLVTRKDIVTTNEIGELMELLLLSGEKKLAIFCDSIEKEVVGFLVANKAQGIFQTLLVKTKDMEDLALVTGATIVTDELGTGYTKEVLGKAGKIVSTPYATVVTDGKASQEAIDGRIAEYEEKRKLEPSAVLDKDIARLKGGVSVIRVGGYNEQSTRERKLKTEDAVNAVRSALSEGVIPGAGECLASLVSENYNETMNIVLTAPQVQLTVNADGKEIDKDVIDPAKVMKSALSNAIATGNMILTAEAGIYHQKEK